MKTIRTLKTGHQTDEMMHTRFKELCAYFKRKDLKQNYVEFNGYYIALRKNGDEAGIRWFHRNKYLVDVVVSGESGPSYNIAEWALFSKYEDAILSMTLSEGDALRRLEKQERKAQI